MSEVVPGRYTAQMEGSFVIFRLGIRINRFYLFWKWIPTLIRLVPLLRGLHRERVSGLLEGFFICYLSAGMGIVQYWRSFDDLERFVHSKDNTYSKLWRCYESSPGSDGTVGIWYEMFPVEEKQYEVVYDNMPIVGLAVAGQHVPAVGRRETARRRLGGEGTPAVPSPVNPIYMKKQ